MTRPVLLPVILVVVVASAAAQVAAVAPSLSLQDAQALALKNHPQVQSAELNYLAARQRINEARAAYFPSINGELTGSQGNPQGRIGAGYLTASRLYDRVGQGISVSQIITDSGRTSNLVASSRYEAQAVNEGYQATRADVLLHVNQAYFNALGAQALVKVADATVTARQVLMDQVSALAQSKLRSQLDVSFAGVSLAQAKLLQIRARNMVDESFAELARSLGQSDQVAYTLTDEPLPASPPADTSALIAQAYRDRPELAGARLEHDSAARFESAERDLSFPTLSFMGVAGFIPYIHQLTVQAVPPEYEGAALNLQIPVFNGGLFTARRKAAGFKTRAAEQHVRDMEQKVTRDVRIALSDALTAYHQLDVTAELLRQARMSLDLAQGRYNLGLSSIVELTQAQLNVTQAEVENLNAKYDYEKLHANLQYAIGALR